MSTSSPCIIVFLVFYIVGSFTFQHHRKIKLQALLYILTFTFFDSYHVSRFAAPGAQAPGGGARGYAAPARPRGADFAAARGGRAGEAAGGEEVGGATWMFFEDFFNTTCCNLLFVSFFWVLINYIKNDTSRVQLYL